MRPSAHARPASLEDLVHEPALSAASDTDKSSLLAMAHDRRGHVDFALPYPREYLRAQTVADI